MTNPTLPPEQQGAHTGGHTPGDWSVSDARTVDGHAMVVGGAGQSFGLVAEVTLDEDACVVAAAPALLQAARDLLKCNDDTVTAMTQCADEATRLKIARNRGEEFSALLDPLRAAISLAEGKS